MPRESAASPGWMTKAMSFYETSRIGLNPQRCFLSLLFSYFPLLFDSRQSSLFRIRSGH